MCRKCTHSSIPYAAWRATACCPECYSIAQTINAHYYGKIDSAEAAKRLKDAAWEIVDHILPEVQEYIEHIIEDSGEKAKSKLDREIQKDDE